MAGKMSTYVITPYFGTVYVGHGGKGKNYTAPSLALPQNWEGNRSQKFYMICFKKRSRNWRAALEVPRLCCLSLRREPSRTPVEGGI